MDHGKDVEERALSGRSAGRPGTAGKDPGRRELFGKPYEPELRMGGGIHSIPPHRFKAFRDGLSSRIRQRTDRITLLEEEIDLGTLQGTLKNLRSGRGKEGLGLDGSKPLKKLYAAAGPLTAMELEALCAPGGNNRTTATWQRRPSLQVPHILRKLRKGSDKMNLSHTLCGHSHINALARFLAVHPEIKTLELRNNGITDDGISMLSAALVASGGVTALDLSDNKLRWQGVQALADMLTMKGTQLETLVLDGNRMEDRALEVLGQAMRENLVLRSLSIANCNISHLIANKMERVILNHGGLRELDLSWNKLGAVGARAVAKVLPESNLHVLNLSWTGLGDAGGVAVAAALKQNIALRDLVMSGNQLNTPFCEALVETLQANRSLRTLNLDDNPLGRGGTCALLKCYGRESKLTTLSIERCTFLDDVVSFKDSRTFRVSNPAGRYRLDMEKPENQAIFAALNDLYEGSPHQVLKPQTPRRHKTKKRRAAGRGGGGGEAGARTGGGPGTPPRVPKESQDHQAPPSGAARGPGGGAPATAGGRAPRHARRGQGPRRGGGVRRAPAPAGRHVPGVQRDHQQLGGPQRAGEAEAPLAGLAPGELEGPTDRGSPLSNASLNVRSPERWRAKGRGPGGSLERRSSNGTPPRRGDGATGGPRAARGPGHSGGRGRGRGRGPGTGGPRVVNPGAGARAAGRPRGPRGCVLHLPGAQAGRGRAPGVARLRGRGRAARGVRAKSLSASPGSGAGAPGLPGARVGPAPLLDPPRGVAGAPVLQENEACCRAGGEYGSAAPSRRRGKGLTKKVVVGAGPLLGRGRRFPVQVPRRRHAGTGGRRRGAAAPGAGGVLRVRSQREPGRGWGAFVLLEACRQWGERTLPGATGQLAQGQCGEWRRAS